MLAEQVIGATVHASVTVLQCGVAGVLEQSASEVSAHPGYGYAAMMSPPDVSRLPLEVFASVDAWLAGGAGGLRMSQTSAATAHSDSVEVAVDARVTAQSRIEKALTIAGPLFGLFAGFDALIYTLQPRKTISS